MNSTKKAIVGVFGSEDSLMDALCMLQAENIEPEEIYTPYPVHEALRALKRRSRLSWASWFYGFFGGIAVLAFLYYTAVIDWPLNYGGKPFNAFPSFITVTLVLIILIVTIFTLLTFSIRAKIYPFKKAEIIDERVTNDKFIMVFDAGKVNRDQLYASLTQAEAEEIYEK
ncbi:MAG TPA: DUF3341 domain-containing protein [Bacteroidales bacterium]|nr:DUF3341 domain-containing protein [Bacteroidales bacterium]